MPNPYEVLGVNPNANQIVIEAAYKALVKEHHPDMGGEEEKFIEIKNAYDSLCSNGDPSNDNFNSSFQGFSKGLLGLETPVKSSTIEGSLDDDLTIEQGPMRASLLGLFQTDVSELIYDHEQDGVRTDDHYLCLVHLENISEYVQPWRSDGLVFIASDGQSYSSLRADKMPIDSISPLANQFSINYQDMQPNTWTLGVAIPEELPQEVDIEKVIYNQKVYEGHNTDGHVKEKLRFEFDIDEEKQKSMFSVIAQELMDEAPEDSQLKELT